jgi:hypothetical protein
LRPVGFVKKGFSGIFFATLTKTGASRGTADMKEDRSPENAFADN